MDDEIKALKDHIESKHQISIEPGLPTFLVSQGYTDVGYKADLMTINCLMHIYHLWQSEIDQ